MTDPFVGEIMMFGGNYAPRGWALCNGQIMAISQNTALFALLGTTYGGDGRSNFALPDLRESLATQQGQGAGLQQWMLGQTQGSATVTLDSTQIAPHTHGLTATSTQANQASAVGAQLGFGYAGTLQQSSVANMYSSNPATQAMAPQSIMAGGGGQEHNNLMPYLVVNFCIALQGIWPLRP